MGVAGRIEMMQKQYSIMIFEDLIKPEDLDAAISVIDEFRDYQFSRVKPDWMDYL